MYPLAKIGISVQQVNELCIENGLFDEKLFNWITELLWKKFADKNTNIKLLFS